MRSVLIRNSSLLVLGLVAACGSNDGGPDPLANATTVTITPDTLAVVDCTAGAFTGEVRNGHGTVLGDAPIAWSSLDPGVATVNTVGGVSAVGPGLARIVAAHDTLKDTAYVAVDSGAYTLEVTPTALQVDLSTPTALSAVVRDCHGAPHATAASFQSLDTAVVTSSGAGLVTPHKLGLTKVVVTRGALVDTVGVTVTRAYTFALDTTITGGGQFYGVAVNTPLGFAFANRPAAAAVARFDLLSHAVDLNAVAVGMEPTGIAFDPGGHHAWVASQLSNRVDELNASPVASQGSATLSFDPYWTVTTPNGGLVYASGNASIVAVIAGSSGALIDSIPVASTPFGLAMSPDGASLFVGHLLSPIIERVTVSNNAVSTLTTLGGAVSGMAVSPSGAELAIASQNLDSLYFVNTASGGTIAQVPLDAPWGVAYLPSGGEIWVTSLNGKVYRVNATTHTLTDSIVVGGTPRGISIHPYGWGAVIGNEDGTLEILK